MRKYIAGAIMALALVTLPFVMTGCGQSDADVAAHNISVAAEQFEVPRHIVGINGITDKYLFEIIGYCSVETSNSSLGGSLEVTCKVTDAKTAKVGYKKTFLGLSDNVSYVVEQLEPIQVSTSRYRVIFKPSTLIPNINIQ